MPFMPEQMQIESTRRIGGLRKKKKTKTKTRKNGKKAQLLEAKTHLKIYYFRKNTVTSVQL